MDTRTKLARLAGRRMGEDGAADGDAEEGFTLIELMVVLLIMAILLAIAIPTFLSVTNGAKKTATQSDLTNALQSATALYTKTQTLPSGTTTVARETTFLGDMKATQTTITFTFTAPAKAKNSLAAGDTKTGQLAIFVGEDGATGCWAVVDNQSNALITTAPPGDTFIGYKATVAHPCTLTWIRTPAHYSTVGTREELQDNHRRHIADGPGPGPTGP